MWVIFLLEQRKIGMQFGLERQMNLYDTLLDIWIINNVDSLSVFYQLHARITGKKACYEIQNLVQRQMEQFSDKLS